MKIRFLDERGRVYGKINLLDLLLVLFFVSILGIAAYRLTLGGSGSDTSVPLRIILYEDDIHPEVARNIGSIGEVYFGRGLVKTKVEKVEVLPMPASSRRPDFVEVRITLVGDGYINQDGAYFGNQRVSIGKKSWLRSAYELEATVMDISQIKE